MANLPDPGIGRNPPRYRSFIPPTWGARHIALTVIGAFYWSESSTTFLPSNTESL
jgi:hypothetical protein